MARPVAFITGAGRGVGRAIAVRLARDGYAVAVVGRSLAPLRKVSIEIAAAGGTAHPVVCDVAARGDVQHAVREAERLMGPVDVLVNNAGIAESAPFATMDDELWERTLAVNLTGTFHCMRAIVPGMFERRRGRVINIASAAAKVGFAYTAAYVASKHGVLGLTRADRDEIGVLREPGHGVQEEVAIALEAEKRVAGEIRVAEGHHAPLARGRRRLG